MTTKHPRPGAKPASTRDEELGAVGRRLPSKASGALADARASDQLSAPEGGWKERPDAASARRGGRQSNFVYRRLRGIGIGLSLSDS
ncbi:MAG: hypothetical protein QOG23_4984 [Blastocatellia bacterium]|nr:hypothetical protein [Blastocatellia bacterium]